MPKVMYRPNPVPPPFTPPTPSGIIMFANPANFNPDTSLKIKFNVRPNIDFDYCLIIANQYEICKVYKELYSTTDFIMINVENDGSLPFEGIAEFYSNDELVLTTPLSGIYQEY